MRKIAGVFFGCIGLAAIVYFALLMWASKRPLPAPEVITLEGDPEVFSPESASGSPGGFAIKTSFNDLINMANSRGARPVATFGTRYGWGSGSGDFFSQSGEKVSIKYWLRRDAESVFYAEKSYIPGWDNKYEISRVEYFPGPSSPATLVVYAEHGNVREAVGMMVGILWLLIGAEFLFRRARSEKHQAGPRQAYLPNSLNR